ncbi:MAG: 4-hydroxy-3-methylbut-2-enyl diphosphate reductase [Candidatus Moranbacteria bacterium]|jgi:4-hydroxy-3-methylbut-2-enyl diphosphate reductase|nr:4-hydroxy-3-methylbut-2-enyl diphosphate reductase [Candidatus Moranbacteria bacterium]
MQIIKAKNIGFCGGVRRAFEMVEKGFAEKRSDKKAFTLGSLAHNRGVEKRIKEMGIEKISNLRKVKKGDTVIITAHGSSSLVYERIRARGAKVFDTTCVNVRRVQDLAEEYQKNGWRVIIFGDRKHKEVKGILGHCKMKAEVVSDFKEAVKISNRIKKNKRFDKTVLISQTTKNTRIFKKISDEFRKLSKSTGMELKVFDTICRASHIRQREARKLSRSCDLSIIIGGGESANTKRLWQIAKTEGQAHWIKEVKEELPDALVRKIKKINKKKGGKICIISGASTPPWEIERVEELLNLTV